MTHLKLAASALVLATLSILPAATAVAGPKKQQVESGVDHPKSNYYRGGPKVRGYVARRGGYSYSPEDSINTYGDARSKYGTASSLRDPSLDRQTTSGPFDHGFFFDSGVGFRGGEAPYAN